VIRKGQLVGSYLKQSNLCLMSSGISLQECWRQTTVVLFKAPVQIRKVFVVQRVHSDIMEKKSGSMPYAKIDRIGVLYFIDMWFVSSPSGPFQ